MISFLNSRLRRVDVRLMYMGKIGSRLRRLPNFFTVELSSESNVKRDPFPCEGSDDDDDDDDVCSIRGDAARERIATARCNVGVPEERGDEKRRPGIVRLRYYIQGYPRRVVNSPLLLVPFFRSRASTLFRLVSTIRDDIL